VFRIWAEFVPDATPLAGRAGRYRVVRAQHALCDLRVQSVTKLEYRGQVFDRLICFNASRAPRHGTWVNPKKEIFNV
jgi:hypothetical protein